ncbi:pentapeptide repeat-containing protein [Leptolyngbya iicbica]|uniref:Protein kinase domain-containing protein n=2 Tax=Cyanophyceae TaxID=3028117 RepID=A0A4Q7E6R3_9CYAN|nr:pentapeptide repeat-containing protein [Leptolyngbya sp. LK]RZM77794.1 hypothetical protein DYY88_14560 [Leptolyngbya sp. LK]
MKLPPKKVPNPFAIEKVGPVYPYLDPGKYDISEVRQARCGAQRFYNVTEHWTKQTYSILAYDCKEMCAEEREQLRRQIEALKRLSHLNLPKLIAVQEHRGNFYLVMERILGEPLSAVQQARRIQVEEAVQIIKEAAKAVSYMHLEGNLGHGNLNPCNIFLIHKGGRLRVKVVGLDHSRLDATAVKFASSVTGKLGFLPKRQICEPDFQFASDIFGLGVTALSMLGQIPPDDIYTHIDLGSGKVRFPKSLNSHWEIRRWIRKTVSLSQPYSSVGDAIKGLERNRDLKVNIWKYRFIYGTVIFAMAGGMFWWAKSHQASWIAELEEKNEALAAHAEAVYEAALERKKEQEEQARINADYQKLIRTGSCVGCDFAGLDLRGLDFSGYNLRGADLSGSWLTGTSFEGADLTGANLSEARLDNANLRRANLTDADLSSADLRGASAVQACFVSADLSGTDFRAADLENASFERANPGDAKFGWSSVRRGAIDATGEVWYGKHTAPPACD